MVWNSVECGRGEHKMSTTAAPFTQLGTNFRRVCRAKLCTWHDLRHTFASRLAMAGFTGGTIAALLRHRSDGLVKRYAHLSPLHLKAAVESVARFEQALES